MIRTFRPVGPLVRLSLAAALAVAACGGSPPTSPSPSPTFTPPPVSGRVTGESGAPLEGVTVRLLIVDGPQTAITDGNGRFEFDRAASGAELTAEKPGFEPNVQYLFGQPTQDFTLRGIARIIAGDSRRVTITPLDSLYGFDLEFRSVTVRVVAPRAGRLALQVDADGPGVSPAVAVGALPDYPCCVARRSVDVAAGEEVEVHVMMSWQDTVSRTFTLRTQLES